MSSNSILGRRAREDSALQVGSRKKATTSDPLIARGRHFGRTIYAFCNVRDLITQGLKRVGSEDIAPEDYTAKERQEQKVFLDLLKLCHGLEDKLNDLNISTEEIERLADLIQKGASASRADDTKGMKGAILDWIAPPNQSLAPPLNRRSKVDRGFHHEVTGALLCPAGLNWKDPETKRKLASGEMVIPGHRWPIFLYADSTFDAEQPWKGLLRGDLLVIYYQAFKHIFIAPSVADAADHIIAPKGGNARIHGMKRVTTASIVYVATQVRFALSSASSWSRTDKITDSETFYAVLLETLEDPRSLAHVKDLLSWWDRKIFPYSAPDVEIVPIAGSPLDRIRQIQAQEEIAAAAQTN